MLQAGPRADWTLRGLQRLRALVVCISVGFCLPGTSRWELSWPVHAVATLVSAAVGVAASARSAQRALAVRGASVSQRAAVLVAPVASTGPLPALPCNASERAPGFDGRRLYLEQCTLSC